MVFQERFLDFTTRVNETFCSQIKKRGKLFQVLNDYRFSRISILDLLKEVKSILESHDDLILEFNKFLPQRYEIEILHKSKWQVELISFINSIQIRFRDNSQVYKHFLSLMDLYTKAKKEFVEISKRIVDMLEDHWDLIAEFKKIFRGEEFKGNSRNDLDLSNRESCTPSYRYVPEFRDSYVWSDETEGAKYVLNDEWLCWLPKEDKNKDKGEEKKPRAAQPRRRYNKYDELEDKKFEAEREMECIKSIIHKAEEYTRLIEFNEKDQRSVENYFGPLSIIHIKRLYDGEKGADQIELLRRSPLEALPDIITRLQNKQEILNNPRKRKNLK